MPTESVIAENYAGVLARIAGAARQAGRDPAGVTLVAVSKGQPLAAARALYALGARHFGENRPEEGNERVTQLADCSSVEWHMIGHVQSRKAGLLFPHFNWLHSLDRLKLARRLEAPAAAAGRRLPVLLQMNVSGEGSKSGWRAHDPRRWPSLLPELERILALPGLEVRGLMTMAPYAEDRLAARPFFARLRELGDFLRQRLPQNAWEHLSMGMSGDYEAAVLEGATLLRVGTALFGPPSGE